MVYYLLPDQTLSLAIIIDNHVAQTKKYEKNQQTHQTKDLGVLVVECDDVYLQLNFNMSYGAM